ncbi:MAG: hypothetical protein QGH31_02830 [Kiritimatiellia bacterium]|nr:hypothetical protein [Kiritimatiellia bacterium]
MVSLLALTGDGRTTFAALDETKVRQGLAAWPVRVSASGHDVLDLVKQRFAHDGRV